MTAKILDGKATALTIRREIAERIKRRCADGRRAPGLAAIIVGENPASRIYVRNKRRAAEKAGFHSVTHELPANVSREEILFLIDELNGDLTVDGILCQLPLPSHLDESEIIARVNPRKDVDGIHPFNLGRLASGNAEFVPCTPLGCLELLLRYEIPIEGRRAVVVGRSNLVGTPMALLLMQKGEAGDATVTVCHSKTADLSAECSRADILVVAIGKARTITADMVKEGAVVIDVGINRIEDRAAPKGERLVGDVDFDAVKDKASAITPVPGGVGPMTIAMLLRNTLQAWERRHPV